MRRIAALTSGRYVPSSRYRVRQHIPGLRQLGIDVVEYCPAISQHAKPFGGWVTPAGRTPLPLAAVQGVLNGVLRVPGILGSWACQATWIERRFLPGFDWSVEVTRGPRILDADDAIWLEGRGAQSGVPFMARHVDAVIAGNDFLANWFAKYCKRIHVVPTGVDCERYAPPPTGQPRGEKFTVGWIGTSSNFRYLALVYPALAQFLRRHDDTRFLVVADRPPETTSLPSEQVEFRRWSPDTEPHDLQAFDVGIMPLDDTEWTRGKCSFKMLQYMATGTAVIASPVGMNRDILRLGEFGLAPIGDSDWYDALELLYANAARRAKLGARGREIAKSAFGLDLISRQLGEIFASLLGP